MTPWLLDSIVLLGTQLSFGRLPALLAHFTGVRVSAETVRRLTEAAGALVVAHETAVVCELEHTLPEPPAGPPLQQLSVDGAMVPLRNGAWAEVKTVVLGTVADGHATDLSYFSRKTDAETFARLATGETHRRGTSTAGPVVAVSDGATWCQRVVDWHRPDAVRILDLPHALEHLGKVAQMCFGPATATASTWLEEQGMALRAGRLDDVLTALHDLAVQHTSAPSTHAVVLQTHAYLATRRPQVQYQAFVAAGYPIGSGAVESANKLVVEARLKGAGMHWAETHIDPMLALRTHLLNNRWEEGRAVVAQAWRQHRPVASAGSPPVPKLRASRPPLAGPPSAPARPATIVHDKPTAEHPWRKSSPFPAKR
ncbi:MAG: hypothetical protein ACR2OE_17645 [Thermomicrobiales bacterium]